VIVHARNAWLDGLSPKENREIPPLRYEVVHALKRARPELTIVINGGITTLDACEAQLEHVDGVMLGREAYYNPWILAGVDERLYGDSPGVRSRGDAVRAYLPYVQKEIEAGTPLQAITRQLLALALGLPGARAWRRTLSEEARLPGAGADLLEAALERLESAALPPREVAAA
jgi:tRNA-dihydrouridine synthase A